MRVARKPPPIDGESQPDASESRPLDRIRFPTRLDQGRRQGRTHPKAQPRKREDLNMRRTALFVVAASLVQGCAPEGPLGVVGAIVTAPITAPIMFFSARMNDREDFLERARQNQRPLPPIDARSRDQAQATLEQALERGSIDQGIYWQNNQDASGYAAGGGRRPSIDPRAHCRFAGRRRLEPAQD